MSGVWQVHVYENQQVVFSTETDGPLELGRQKTSTENLFAVGFCAKEQNFPDRQRLTIALRDETDVSRTHALLTPLDGDRLSLLNTSNKQAIKLADGTLLQHGCARELALPALFTVGKKSIRIQPSDEPQGPQLHALPEATCLPGSAQASSLILPTLAGRAAVARSGDRATTEGDLATTEAQALVSSIRTVLDVFQSAANSLDFFPRAARAIVDMVGLELGRVLLLDGDKWKLQAVHPEFRAASHPDWQPSRQILGRVRQEKKTFWEDPSQSSQQAASLQGIRYVVAAPILDRLGNVIGALYGEQRQDGRSTTLTPITNVQAMFVDLLASGVASGLARLEQEQKTLAAQVQFEQFFTRELSRQLAAEPDLLQGRDSEVTVMFCDIRSFSRISELLGPAATVQLINDVMEKLSDRVLAHRGVLVDYIGDELLAMWGAPEKQADHAQLACRAALEMWKTLPELNERWQPIIKEELKLGIGINSGMARVGNTGSKHKFKYGPLGNNVNLASRVQGATKYLKAPILLTEATRALLGTELPTRRLCRVRVVNIAEPVALYQLAEQDLSGWPQLHEGYQGALEAFEKKEFRQAARILGKMLTDYPNDGPSLVLMSRVVNCLVDEPREFDPVWVLPGK